MLSSLVPSKDFSRVCIIFYKYFVSATLSQKNPKVCAFQARLHWNTDKNADRCKGFIVPDSLEEFRIWEFRLPACFSIGCDPDRLNLIMRWVIGWNYKAFNGWFYVCFIVHFHPTFLAILRPVLLTVLGKSLMTFFKFRESD